MDGVEFVNEHRGAPIWLMITLMAVLGVGLAVSLFLNFMQSQRAEQERRQLKGEITDLRYALTTEKSAGTPAPSATPEATPTPAPSAAPTPEATPAVLGDETAPAAATATTTIRVRLRAAASTTSRELDWIPAGTAVTLGSYSDAKWQEVTAAGKHGYIYKKYLKY